jgi:ATP synthase protein I
VGGVRAPEGGEIMPRQDRSSRFKDFDDRMRRLRTDADLPGGEPEPPDRASFGTGVQVGIELVAGVVGGGLIGYGLDRWLETWPILFVVFFFLGAAAGTLNAWRYIRRAGLEAEQDQRPK